MAETRQPAGEFLREMARSQSRVQLGVIAAVAAFTVGCGIAVGLAVGPGWVGVAAAVAYVALQVGAEWWLLGVGRVQRWLRDGS